MTVTVHKMWQHYLACISVLSLDVSCIYQVYLRQALSSERQTTAVSNWRTYTVCLH